LQQIKCVDVYKSIDISTVRQPWLFHSEYLRVCLPLYQKWLDIFSAHY